MKIQEITKDIHKNAQAKGFWESDTIIEKMRNLPGIFSEEEVSAADKAFRSQKLLLIISEITEAMEADRKPDETKHGLDVYIKRKKEILGSVPDQYTDEYKASIISKLYPQYVKDTLPAEIAGATIRILDFCGHEGIDLEGHILAEHEYNLTRPVKHGKNY